MPSFVGQEILALFGAVIYLTISLWACGCSMCTQCSVLWGLGFLCIIIGFCIAWFMGAFGSLLTILNDTGVLTNGSDALLDYVPTL